MINSFDTPPTKESVFDSEAEDRETIEVDLFLNAWDEWHESGVRQELTLDPMHRLLDLVHTQPQRNLNELLHNEKKLYECMCCFCVNDILFFVCQRRACCFIFCENYLTTIVSVWKRLKTIFPDIVDFHSFCYAICSWNV